MKKNSEWAKQHTPEQLEQFKENFVDDNDRSVVDYLELNFSDNFMTFILNAFDWTTSNQGYNYWSDIANGKEPQPIEKPIEEIKEKSNFWFNDLAYNNKFGFGSKTTQNTEYEMRDNLALEAMKALLSDSTPLAGAKFFANRCYEIADAMLEARKPKIQTP